MKKLYFLIFILMIKSAGYTQELEQLNLDVALIAQVNQGNSYVTFPADIGNIESLVFEANIIPNFMLRKAKNSRFIGVLTPQMIIRMYDVHSYPVKTPSYMPKITAYYLIGNRKQKELLTIFGRLGHHSNGQNDTLILADGKINFESGNFATDYFELGTIITTFNKKTRAVRFIKSSFEYHPENYTHQLYEGRFSRYRWNNEFSAFRLPKNENGHAQKADISIDFKTTWLFGDLAGISSFSLDRLQASLTFSYFPKIVEDIGLFVQFYRGKDYYNVYYDKDRSMLRFGLMTNKLRF